jgi:5-methylcytosine-specific restriction endonuclease McrA
MAASGRPALHPTLDHIVPLHRGGADTFENTSAACRRCNSLKDAMTVAEFASAYPDLVRSAPSSGFAEG